MIQELERNARDLQKQLDVTRGKIETFNRFERTIRCHGEKKCYECGLEITEKDGDRAAEQCLQDGWKALDVVIHEDDGAHHYNILVCGDCFNNRELKWKTLYK